MNEQIKRKRLTKEQFLTLSRKLHGDKYNYDDTVVESASSKVKIVCPIHGDFFVRMARLHYAGKGIGCPECTGYIRNDVDTFIKRSREVHGDKYDYSKSIYVASSKKLTVICPEHGPFEITPSVHYGPKKRGCQKCSGKSKLNTESFIKRCRSVHGHKYNYEETVYEGSMNNVIVNCPRHGDFTIRASDHMGGPKRGCPKCKRPSTIEEKVTNTEQFIRKSRKVHGNKYDYTKSIYKNTKEKVIITCPKHGDFEIGPGEHYGTKRQGCAICGGRGKITTESFIARSKDMFGDRFDYSKVKYINARTKVVLTCKEHGDFLVVPGAHYNSNGGCSYCSGRGEITSKNLVRRLRKQFGENYDFSKVDYQGGNVPVSVICLKHGEFKGLPQTLLKVQGCPACYSYTVDDFKRTAIEIHGEQYDYSKVKYESSSTYVDIICRKHGIFNQRPRVHLHGRGCPTCGIEKNLLSNRNPNAPCILYYLTLDYKGHLFWKVGITTRSIERRYHKLHMDRVRIVDSSYINTTIGKAIKAENSILTTFDEFLEYRGHILQHSKGGTETFSQNILELSGKSLGDFIVD